MGDINFTAPLYVAGHNFSGRLKFLCPLGWNLVTYDNEGFSDSNGNPPLPLDLLLNAAGLHCWGVSQPISDGIDLQASVGK